MIAKPIRKMLNKKAEAFIESTLKPKHVLPPPTDHDFNYVAGIVSKWHQHYLYICATWNCPSPRAVAPSIEVKFARIEYVDEDCFNLSYLRHNNKWFELKQGIDWAECTKMISEDEDFMF